MVAGGGGGVASNGEGEGAALKGIRNRGGDNGDGRWSAAGRVMR